MPDRRRRAAHPLFRALLAAFACGALACASGIYQHSALVSGDEPAAELVLFRKSELAGSALALTIRLDGEKLAKLRTGRYAEFRVQPGNHQLTMDDPGNLMRVDAAVLDGLQFEPGTRTYVLLSKHHFAWGAGASVSTSGASSSYVSAQPIMGFRQIQEEEARQLISSYERVED